jgi:hypothetical protein
MTTTTTGERCAHEMCLCTKPYPASTQAAATERIDPNGEFCSRRCADQEHGEMGDGCECGHPPCQAPADKDQPVM